MNLMRRPDYAEWPKGSADTSAFSWLPALISFLRRSWATVAVSVLAGLILAVAYYVVATPKFTAGAQLLIDTRAGDLFKSQQAGSIDSTLDNAIVESQVQVLGSDGIARRVVRSMHLSDDAQFMSWGDSYISSAIGLVSKALDAIKPSHRPETGDDHDSAAVELLSRMTTVRRVGLSDIIEVSVRTPDADRSAALTNAITTAFIDDQLDAKYATTRRAGGWLQDRLKELRDQASAADQAVQDYRAKYGIADTDKGMLDQQQLGDLSLQLAQARARAAETASRYNSIDAIRASGAIPSTASAPGGSTVSDALQNTVILKLQQQYLDDQRRLADWTVKYGANHVATVGVRTEMAGLQKAIQTEIDRIYESYKSDYEVAKANEAGIEKQMGALVSQSGETNSQRVELRSLQSLSDTYRSLYSSFLQRYSQAVQDQTFPIAQARVVTSAVAPLHKSWPTALLVLPAGAVLGMLLGFGVALLREILDQRLWLPSRVRDVVGLETLAQLPQLRSKEYAPRRAFNEEGAEVRERSRALSTRPSILRMVSDNPLSAYAESMRGVRVRIAQRRARSRDFKVIGVVSVNAGEGKSTIAANLAHLLAVSGSRTILLDWDLRKATLTNAMTLRAPAGFNDIVSGTATLDGTVWRDPQDGMAFLPATSGKVDAHSVEVLGSERSKATLDALREAYDTIVVDLPPLNAVTDASAVAPLVDGFVVALAWGVTREDDLVDSLTRSGFTDEQMLGVIFNKVDVASARRAAHGDPASYRPVRSLAES